MPTYTEAANVIAELVIANKTSEGITEARIAYATMAQANIQQDIVERTSAEFRENMYVKLPANASDPLYVARLGSGCFAYHTPGVF